MLKVGKKVKTTTVGEAILQKLAEAALKGDRQAGRVLFVLANGQALPIIPSRKQKQEMAADEVLKGLARYLLKKDQGDD